MNGILQQPAPPPKPDYHYISSYTIHEEGDQVIREETQADKLQFDMGKWSDEKPVKNPCKYYEQ